MTTWSAGFALAHVRSDNEVTVRFYNRVGDLQLPASSGAGWGFWNLL